MPRRPRGEQRPPERIGAAIRPARSEDAARLAALMEAAYAPHVARLGSSLPVGGDDIARDPIWVAEQGGRMVGALVLQPQPDHLRLANVAVRPDHQGRGIGRALLRQAEAEARARGYQEMRLFTHTGMPDNIALYERHGWTQLRSAPGSVRVAMIKRLAPGDSPDHAEPARSP